jgi:tetraacyldisaccharide 4'-kinase
MKPPSFWQDPAEPLGRILSPLGWIYAEATAWRLAHAQPWRAPVPVVCVGNLTAGGAGKTPIVRDLAARIARSGLRPHILSRGYGGRERGPVLVDPERGRAQDVGDEPLLLARDAPCWVAADRAEGARAIAAAGGDLILMDDGLQNPQLAQDLRLIVVDGEAGFGNRRAIPAGPLRERIGAGLGRADALIVMGPDRRGVARDWTGRLPPLFGRLVPCDAAWLKGATLVAFAGIGRPEKFRATLAEAGAGIARFHGFSDHHAYSERTLAMLARNAERLGATLVTTEKDWVRLALPWRQRVRAVPVAVRWKNEALIDRLVDRISRRD